ncbi:MAG TPA: hypothetical protein VGL62_10915 [Vicinamibacterales bacterium]
MLLRRSAYAYAYPVRATAETRRDVQGSSAGRSGYQGTMLLRFLLRILGAPATTSSADGDPLLSSDAD